MLDDHVHGPRRQKRPALALVTGLGALFATRWILATLRCAGRRISARGNRRVTRAAVQPALEQGDPLILASDMRLQLLDTAIHPQENLDNDLAPTIVNRLRLNSLHTTKFDKTELCPPQPTEHLHFLCLLFALELLRY
jgi:hypothetical protein